MKTGKLVSSVIATLLILALPYMAFADGQSGTRTLRKVIVWQFGAISVVGETAWNDPDSCSGNATVNQIILPPPKNTSGKYYSEMYAMVVASYLQGKSVSSYLNGCYPLNGGNYPIMNTVNSSN